MWILFTLLQLATIDIQRSWCIVSLIPRPFFGLGARLVCCITLIAVVVAESVVSKDIFQCLSEMTGGYRILRSRNFTDKEAKVFIDKLSIDILQYWRSRWFVANNPHILCIFTYTDMFPIVWQSIKWLKMSVLSDDRLHGTEHHGLQNSTILRWLRSTEKRLSRIDTLNEVNPEVKVSLWTAY